MKAINRFATLGFFSLLLMTLSGLAGCGNRLAFSERTGFNLGVSVGQDPATPVKVNAGLDRTVVGMIPPRRVRTNQQGRTIADDEAVSLFSGFYLNYTDIPDQVFDKLTIKTQFASGLAAITLAEEPDAVNRFINVKGVKILPGQPDRASSDLDTLLGFDGSSFNPEKVKQMKEQCWPEAGVPPNTKFMDFMQDPQFSEERIIVRDCMIEL